LYVVSEINPCDQKNSALELKSVANSRTGLPSCNEGNQLQMPELLSQNEKLIDKSLAELFCFLVFTKYLQIPKD